MNEDAGPTLQKCPTYNNAVENEKGDLSLSLSLITTLYCSCNFPPNDN